LCPPHHFPSIYLCMSSLPFGKAQNAIFFSHHMFIVLMQCLYLSYVIWRTLSTRRVTLAQYICYLQQWDYGNEICMTWCKQNLRLMKMNNYFLMYCFAFNLRVELNMEVAKLVIRLANVWWKWDLGHKRIWHNYFCDDLIYDDCLFQ